VQTNWIPVYSWDDTISEYVLYVG